MDTFFYEFVCSSECKGSAFERRKGAARHSGKGKENSVFGAGKGKEAGKCGVVQGFKDGKRPRNAIEEITFLSDVQMDAELGAMEVTANINGSQADI